MRFWGRSRNRASGTEDGPGAGGDDAGGGGRGRRRIFSAALLVVTLTVVTKPGRKAARSVARWLDSRVDDFSQPGSQTYSRVVSPVLGRLYRGVAKDVVAELAERGRTRKATILDLGCGPGDLALELAHRLRDARVVGLDLSPSMMQLASRHATTDGRLRFIVGKAEALPMADESVDLVVSTLSLHHFAAPGAAFAEVARVLRPGGVALIYDVGLLSLEPSQMATIARDAGLDPDDLRRERVKGSLGARLLVRFRLEGPDIADDQED
jgi:SAM-dependent methyltransferase